MRYIRIIYYVGKIGITAYNFKKILWITDLCYVSYEFNLLKKKLFKVCSWIHHSKNKKSQPYLEACKAEWCNRQNYWGVLVNVPFTIIASKARLWRLDQFALQASIYCIYLFTFYINTCNCRLKVTGSH